jgi:hypothetical protein
MAKLPKDERDLLASLRTQLRQCVGFEGDKLANDRASAWRYYFGRPRGDEVVGRSDVVSGDLSAMTEAVLSQMDDAFTTGRLIEYEADGADDVDQAQLESDTVCQFVGRRNGNMQMLSAVKSALLLRNGIIKVWVEVRSETHTENYIDVTPEAIAAIAQGKPGITTRIPEGGYDPDEQTLEIEVTKTSKRLRVDFIPMYNFVYPDDWNSADLAECPIMFERHVEERAKLLERGFKKSKVDQVRKMMGDNSVDSLAQNPGSTSMNRTGLDSSQDQVEWFEAYANMDDGKGQSKRYCISFADNVLLDKSPDSIVPYAAGAVFINPGRFTGISLYDKLKTVQDVNTGLERALLDNVNTVNKNRTAYMDGLVNVDDLSDGRTNNNIRVRAGVVPDVRAAITAFTIPDQSAGILSNIQDQKSRRSEMGGAALTLATGEMQMNDRIGSQGIDRAYSVMEQLSAHMTRNMARTLIRSLYLIAHAQMRRHFDYPVSTRQGERWQTTVPSEWVERENCNVKPGMSPGERQRKALTFEKMMQGQIQLASSGMDEIIVSLDTFYTTMMDWARISDIDNPERYYVDPRSNASLKAQQGKQAAGKQQTDMQNLLITQAIKLEQMRSAIDKYRADQDTQFKYYNANLSAQIEEAKLVGAAAAELIKLYDSNGKVVDQIGGTEENGKGDDGDEGTREGITEQPASAADSE